MSEVIKIVPQLVTAGVFDSSQIYQQTTVNTRNRRVSMYEVELPIGNKGISHIGSNSYSVSENTILCAKPGQIRHTTLPYKCYYIHVIVKDCYYADCFNKLPDIISVRNRNIYLKLYDEIIDAYSNSSSANDIYIESKLLEFLYLLTNETSIILNSENGSRSNAEAVQMAVDFISSHFAENITLDDMAEHVHLSSIYFHNMFKAAVGQTPHKYLLSTRLAHAKKMLNVSRHSFAEIANSCGFPSQSYFNYVFKREFNITPRQYRQEISRSWDL